jgi:ABC-type transport system involved in cytochrome bd biosynthesis fused ATPase/permease subunit
LARSFLKNCAVEIGKPEVLLLTLWSYTCRALYHDSDIYLFDDILSAVDSQVASWILEKAIVGPQMKRKTRLLSTHNLHVINLTKQIVACSF